MDIDAQQDLFRRLIREGMAAKAAGDRRRAHELLREAAQINPYDEKVWLALFQVIESDDDRRVCLENIIAINPLNVKARQRLNALNQRLERQTQIALKRQTQEQKRMQIHRKQRRRFITRLIGEVVLALLMGLLGGVIISIIAYGGVL